MPRGVIIISRVNCDNTYTKSMGTGYWVLGTGYWVLGTGYWVLGTGYWVLGTGYWVLGTGYWVLGTGYLGKHTFLFAITRILFCVRVIANR